MGPTASATSYLVFVGAVVMTATVFTLFQVAWFKWLSKRGRRVYARVTRCVPSHEQRYRRMWLLEKDVHYVTAEWKDPTGKTHIFRQRTYSRSAPGVGDVIPVLIDPQKPHRYYIL